MGESLSKPFDLVLGRRTYEIFAAHWPYADDFGAEPLNRATKHVASTTLNELEWNNSKLIEGEVPEAIRTLKQEDGPELRVLGSSDLLQTLIGSGLVDEFRLWVFPVIAGSGKRLFGEGAAPSGLRLVNSSTSTSGVVVATYEPEGEIRKGSFAFEEPTELEVKRRESLGDSAS